MERALRLAATALLLGLPCSVATATEPEAASPSPSSEAPGVGPTEGPSAAPTETTAPSEGPTAVPTEGPTEGPIETPTETPTEGSTEAPSTSSDAVGDRTDRPWMVRWTPERNQIEVGLYGGLMLPSRRVELFEASFDLEDQGYQPFARVGPDLGLRVGYLPSRWLGLEAEGGVMPTRADPRGRALLWTARGSVVGQLGVREGWSVTPFALLGGGLLGVRSKRDVVGNDVDASMHLGGGVKVYFNRYTALRVDVRDVITARQGYKDGMSHNVEILLGMTVTLGRAPQSSDGPGEAHQANDQTNQSR